MFCAAAVGEVADDVFDHDDRAVDDHAEVECAEREQVGGDVRLVEADGGEDQRERNGEGDDDGAAGIAEEQEQDDDDEDDAFGEVVQDGVGGVVQQLGAVEEGDDLYAGRKDAVLSSSTFSWMPSRVWSELAPFCMRTMPSTTSSLSMILPSTWRMACFASGLVGGVVDAGIMVGAKDGSICGGRGHAFAAGFADLAEADLWSLDDGGDVADVDGCAVLGFEQRCCGCRRRCGRGRPRGR